MELIMKRFKSIMAGILFSVLAVSGHAQNADQVTVTYIANSGFLVSCRGRTILIDALFNQGWGEYLVPSPALRADMIAGRAPFTRIDALLITHSDADHFNVSDVVAFLVKHPETRLYASPQVCAGLTNTASIAKQVIPMEVPSDGQARIEIGERLSVTAYRLKHTQDDADARMNYGYLVSFAGVKVFFPGDTTIEISRQSMEKFKLGKEKIDVFFIQYFDLAPVSRAFVRTVVRPRHLVATHVPAESTAAKTSFLEVYPGAIVLEKSLDSIQLPVGGPAK
jgi:L-ascorbate metabolism protein UlaG (beta-lactamase superfamily)